MNSNKTFVNSASCPTVSESASLNWRRTDIWKVDAWNVYLVRFKWIQIDLIELRNSVFFTPIFEAVRH